MIGFLTGPLKLVWAIVTLPVTIVSFFFKLAMLLIIVVVSFGLYLLGERIGWDIVFDFIKEVFNV
tara:strand:+ start:440 stop:634 length:195 start_codon:yes stop_codon:yes gene_type:complete